MTSHLHRPSRRLAWLALTAMLLVFVGPLIGQLQRLPSADDMRRAHAELDQAAPYGMAQAAHAPPASAPPQAPSAERHRHHPQADSASATALQGGSHHDLAACGYCVLFAHVPAQAVAVRLPDSTPVASHRLPAAPALAAPASSAYPAFIARAPPEASRA
ncbi:DUF2946 family protein [Halomonas sp. V046]|uniref:DUF2946 family protein n=1 Tax=Halomonas sp. V046 TaxID=3459611 RepID=UPI0040445898